MYLYYDMIKLKFASKYQICDFILQLGEYDDKNSILKLSNTLNISSESAPLLKNMVIVYFLTSKFRNFKLIPAYLLALY